MSTISILGYSERGIFNSIVFYLGEHGKLICEFIKTLGIDDDFFKDDCITYTFLIEQSFSDFGDSDLVIIAENKAGEKRVVFVEGKVKTQQKQTFVLEKTNVFEQLNNKYMMVKGNVASKSTHKIVLKVIETIKGAERYYFVAILPLDTKSTTFQNGFKKLLSNLEIPENDIRNIYWGDIEQLFVENSNNIVIKNFFYNREQIY
jgi:hypothetical protein